MSRIPAVELACKTDPGRDPEKQVNEDTAANVETALGQLAIVCDGMGGHAGGKEASELAVKTILEIVSSAPEVTNPRDALKVAIEEANRRVWSMPTAEHGYRPGSTVVAILCHAGGAEIAHVGDSRIYLVHAGAISQVTKDHSMVQEMVDRNLIRAEDAPNHPDANKIMRALGIAKDVDVDLRAEPIAFVAGDTFILCSDGLSDLVNAAEILDIAGSKPPMQAAGQLVDLANARGGHDNITAMIVRLKTTAAPNAAPTIVKTVQVTQHEPIAPPPAEEGGSGPRGTLLAEPGIAAANGTLIAEPGSNPTAQAQPGSGGTALVSPMMHASTSGPHLPVPPEVRRQMSPPDNSRAVMFAIAAVIAVVLIGGAVGLYLYNEKEKHQSVVPIVGLPSAAAPTTPAPPIEAEGGAAPEIPATPPLAPSGSGRSWHTTRPYATGYQPAPTPVPPPAQPPPSDPPVCAQARAAPAGPTQVRLAAMCRAAGGSL